MTISLEASGCQSWLGRCLSRKARRLNFQALSAGDLWHTQLTRNEAEASQKRWGGGWLEVWLYCDICRYPVLFQGRVKMERMNQKPLAPSDHR